jgi:cell wall-associated NlpC family hydrolase
MTTIICPLSYIPLRKEASHRSEQTSQLLFGEKAEIIDSKGQWYKVKVLFDGYEGWVERNAVQISKSDDKMEGFVSGFARLVNLTGDSLWLSTGSVLSNELINSQHTSVVTINPDLKTDSIIDIALQFIGTPYLWGGRSFMGIDCSGFTQVAYKALKKSLPRDASQQVNLGSVVQFPSDAQEGDLAFFDNTDGEITHVGIILDQGKIIHASGSVRIDNFDQQGIFNVESGKYTHNLRVIKRVRQAN